MATTNFVDGTTVVQASWLNDVDQVVYEAVVNVKNQPYSATGNGSTDDTAAIQAAINAVFAAGGGTIYFPPGNYRVTSLSLSWGTLPTSIVFAGAGQFATSITKIGASTNSVFTLDATLGDGTYSEFRDMTISGNNVASSGIRASLMARNVFKSIRVTGATSAGIIAEGSLINSFYDCNLIGNVDGYRCVKNGIVRCNLVEFFGGSVRNNSNWGFDIGDTSGLHLYGTDIESNGTPGNIGGGLIIRSTCGDEYAGANISLNGVWFEGNNGTSLWSESAPNLILKVCDTPIISPEGNRAINIGAISALILDSVWANGASGAGDTTIIAAVSCSIRDCALRVLTDTSTKRQYQNSTIAGILVPFRSSSNSGSLTVDGPSVNSGAGNTATVSGVATTIATISGASPALYEVFACLGGAGATYMSTARVGWDAANLTRIGGENGANLTITTSGANIQVTQISGINQIVAWFLLKIA